MIEIICGGGAEAGIRLATHPGGVRATWKNFHGQVHDSPSHLAGWILDQAESYPLGQRGFLLDAAELVLSHPDVLALWAVRTEPINVQAPQRQAIVVKF